MKENKDVLGSILKTTQMGQLGIEAVADKAVSCGMKDALRSQKEEYDSIEREALQLAKQHGWVLKNLDPAVKLMAKAMVRPQLSFGNVDSKIAAMMVNGNTRGMIKGLKNLHHCRQPDAKISQLGQKLLQTEQSNIHQMQGFI